MHSMVVDRISKHSEQYMSSAVMGLEMSYPAVGILKSGYIHHLDQGRYGLFAKEKSVGLSGFWSITVPRAVV